MLLVDKDARYPTGSRVQVFIRTPRCEIDIPIMQAQRNVANRMSQIKTDNASLKQTLMSFWCLIYLFMTCLCNGRQIKYLASHELNSSKQDNCDRHSFPFNYIQNILGIKCLFTRSRGNLDDRRFRIKAMPFGLRFNYKLQAAINRKSKRNDF